MNLYSFVYDKQDGSPPRRRFVCTTAVDRLYIKGYDLEDGVHKSFMQSRVKDDTFQHNGSYDESVLRSSKLLKKHEVYELLGWDSLQQNVANDLQVSNSQLEKLVFTKTGKNIFGLVDDYFLMLEKKEILINMNVMGANLSMKIREGVIEYFDGSQELTLLDFTRKILVA